jgi:hypothetical protein
LDLSTTTINAAYLGPWAAHYAGLLGQDWSGVLNYLIQRANYLRGTMPLNTPFAITSNGGQDFATTTNQVTLSGTAPLTLDQLQVNGVRVPLTWTSLTNWTLHLELSGYTNLLVLRGLDHRRNVMTNIIDSITVTNTAAAPALAVVINEWMADNAGPGGVFSSIDNGYPDWFELFNPNPAPIDLSGFFLTDDLSVPDMWRIPANTIIPGQGFLLVWADNAPLPAGTDAQGDLHAPFQLNKAGDAIGLYGPDGVPQHTLLFGTQLRNVSEGLFPDGNTNAVLAMPDWTPRAPNRVGALSAPAIDHLALDAAGTLTLTIKTTAGHTYRVETTPSLAPTAWVPFGEDRVAANSSLNVIDHLSQDGPRRFYRVLLLP